MINRQVVFSEIGRVVLEENDWVKKDLENMDVVVRTEASIISAGTEIARLNGEEENSKFPFYPGYGCIGIIIEMGSQIQGFSIGDRVFYAGKHMDIQVFRHGENHQWAYLFPVPKDIDPVNATLACMMNIAMTAPNMSSIYLGDQVAVYGLGLVGILTSLLYQLQGAEVIGIDPNQKRCQLAKELGIKKVIDVEPAKQKEAVMMMTNDKGANVTVDAVGHSAVVKTCIETTRDQGSIYLLGSPRKDYITNVTDYLWDIHLKGKKIIGAHMFQYPVKEDKGVHMHVSKIFKASFDMIIDKKIDVSKLISHIIKPEQIIDAYEGLQNNPQEYTCVVIDWRN